MPVLSATLRVIWSSRFSVCPNCSKLLDVDPVLLGVIVSFQQIDTVAAGQAVASPMRRLGM